LAIDDDPLVLNTLRRFLSRWGVRLISLDDPRLFWETLQRTNPDLLILDIEMPHISGIELCKVVRNDITWNGLPILFLSALRDAETIQSLYQAGADDYIAKPFTEPELITRIFNRLERNRLLRNLTHTDSLTGIASRQQATREFHRYLALSRRYQVPLCMAVLRLNHLRQINEQYGPEMGNQLLKQIAQHLKHLFRNEDVIARWGSQEFIIGVYGLIKQRVTDRLQRVLEAFQQDGLKLPLEPALLTLSIGLSEAPHDGIDLPSLYQSAQYTLRQTQIVSDRSNQPTCLS
jgi:diguanylate cyclase (GGDEF)-like protein